MAGVVPVLPRFRFFDAKGDPLSGGSVTVYYAGTTAKTLVFQDRALSIAQENPVELDADGAADIWVTPGLAVKFLLKDAAGVTVPGGAIDDIPSTGDATSPQIQQTTIDRFSGTGAQTAFTLSVTPASENDVDAYVAGVYQQKDTFSLVGTTLTFAVAPAAGTNNVEIVSRVLLDYATFAQPLIALAGEATGAAEAANGDAQQTAQDRVQTGLDRIQTGQDRVQTGQDRLQTGLDRAAASNSAANADTSEASAAAIVLGNFAQAGSSQVRSYTGRFRDWVSLLDFIPSTEHAAIRARASVIDCYPYWVEAHTSQTFGSGIYISGPPVYVPSGQYEFGTAMQPKRWGKLYGEGSGMPGGPDVVFRWAAGKSGIVIHRHNTMDNLTVASTTAADGFMVEGIQLVGQYSATPDAMGGHGVSMRARGVLRNCLISGFSGDGIHIIAVSGGGGATEGNANGWVVDTCRSQNNGEWGLQCAGADANAGRAASLDCSQNGTGGIFDNSFLGNTYIQPQAAGDGSGIAGYNTTRARSGLVWFGGQRYTANYPATDAQLVATTPGTDSTIWAPGSVVAFGNPTHPLWVAAQPVGTYFASSSYRFTNANSRGLVDNPYEEGGYAGAYSTAPTQFNNGQLSGAATLLARWIASTIGLSCPGQITAATLSFTAGTKWLDTQALFNWEQKATTGRWSMYWANIERDHWTLYDRGASTGGGYARTVDATAPGGNNGSLGIGAHYFGSRTQMKFRGLATAAPVGGTIAYLQGDYLWNSAPTAGNALGWTCLAAGTPGTWVEGSILPGDNSTNITQATNKATAVTLNKRRGHITMVAGTSIAANGIATFTLNNNIIGVDDSVYVQRDSGGTASSYNVWCDSTAAGSCVICVHNVTAGALAEAVRLKFSVIS